jgi:hypothetical protein
MEVTFPLMLMHTYVSSPMPKLVAWPTRQFAKGYVKARSEPDADVADSAAARPAAAAARRNAPMPYVGRGHDGKGGVCVVWVVVRWEG